MRCELCNRSNWIPGKLLKKCKHCGLVRAQDFYFGTDLDKVYNDTYYNSGDYLNYVLEKKALEKNFSLRLKIIKQHVKGGSLLEVGCAYGYFLGLATHFFKVTGIERNPIVAEETSERLGICVKAGPFEKVKLDSTFDAIVALDTIEHVASPLVFLNNCNVHLKNGGYIFLETGDIDTVNARIRKEKWRLVKPPEHLYYFSKKTLSALLQKTGFEVIEVRYPVFCRTLGQTIYRLFPSRGSLLFLQRLTFFSKVLIPTNTFDLMFVVAKKI